MCVGYRGKAQDRTGKNTKGGPRRLITKHATMNTCAINLQTETGSWTLESSSVDDGVQFKVNRSCLSHSVCLLAHAQPSTVASVQVSATEAGWQKNSRYS
jgi:hypothetical protein